MKDELNMEIFSAICQITSLYIKQQIQNKQDQEKAFETLNDIVQIFQVSHQEDFEAKNIDEQVFPHDQFQAIIPDIIQQQNITTFYQNIKEHLKLKTLDKIISCTLQSNDKKFVIFESFKIISILFYYEFLLAQTQSMLSKEIQQKILNNCKEFNLVKQSFQQPDKALEKFFEQDFFDESSQQIVEVFLKIIKNHMRNLAESKEGYLLITDLLFQRQFKESKFSKIDIFSIIRMIIEILGVSLDSYKQSLFMRQTVKGIKAKSIEISQGSQVQFNCPFVVSQEKSQIKIYLFLTYTNTDDLLNSSSRQSNRLESLQKLQHSVKSQKTIMLPNSTKNQPQQIVTPQKQNQLKVKDSLMQQDWFNNNEPYTVSLNQLTPNSKHHHSFSVQQNKYQQNQTIQQQAPQIFQNQNFFDNLRNFESEIDQILSNAQRNDHIINELRFKPIQNVNVQKRYYSQEELQQMQGMQRHQQRNNSGETKLIRYTTNAQYIRSPNQPPPTFEQEYNVQGQIIQQQNYGTPRTIVYKRVLTQQK